MIVRFYRNDGAQPAPSRLPLPGTSTRLWRPLWDGFPPPGSRRLSNAIWWAFEGAGLFARDGFAELSIWRDKRMLHRMIVTPRWYRFPFMDARDLQLGDLWTHPDARGRGLARAAVGEALRRFGGGGTNFWYLTPSNNQQSIRLIESCGFSFIGTGCRTRPLGNPWLGRFKLDERIY